MSSEAMRVLVLQGGGARMFDVHNGDEEIKEV
jgi:hypothetical protein